MMWPKLLNVMWNNSSEEVTTNQYSLSSSRICERQVENCSQAGTTKEQTGQNFVKKLMKTAETRWWSKSPKWKSEAIHRSHPQRCQRNNSQRKEERLHPRLECTAAGTSQYCQQTQREDGILPNRWKHSCLQQSQNRIYRQKLQQTCAAWHEKNVFPQHGKRYGQVVEAH